MTVAVVTRIRSAPEIPELYLLVDGHWIRRKDHGHSDRSDSWVLGYSSYIYSFTFICFFCFFYIRALVPPDCILD